MECPDSIPPCSKVIFGKKRTTRVHRCAKSCKRCQTCTECDASQAAGKPRCSLQCGIGDSRSDEDLNCYLKTFSKNCCRCCCCLAEYIADSVRLFASCGTAKTKLATLFEEILRTSCYVCEDCFAIIQHLFERCRRNKK